jgi:hypothetical protein
MSSDELRLNSLERFRKSASRLVLEEHSHCEVPAGCGGVVMRWHNPDAGLPILFVLGGCTEAQLYLDGQELASSRTVASWGEHELLLHIREGTQSRLLLVATVRDITESIMDVPYEQRGIRSGCTAEDGTWLVSTDVAGPQSAADADWQPLRSAGTWQDVIDEDQHWQVERVERFGALALELPDRVNECWVRTRFRIEREA